MMQHLYDKNDLSISQLVLNVSIFLNLTFYIKKKANEKTANANNCSDVFHMHHGTGINSYRKGNGRERQHAVVWCFGLG